MIIEPTDRVRTLEHRGAVYRFRKELDALEHGPKPTSVLEYDIEGPRGCVGGETIIGGERVDTLRARVVETLSGPVLSGIPFVKGYAPLYRVTLESGASILATDAHRFLARAPSGDPAWTRLDEIVPGTELLSVRAAGAHHSRRTAQGSLADCRPAPHSGGEPPLDASAAAQARAPSRFGALAHSRAGQPAGALACAAARTRSCRSAVHRATPGSANQHCSPLAAESRARANSGAPNDESASLPLSRSHSEALHRVLGERRWRGASHRLRTGASSCPDDRPTWDRIKSVRYERTDFFFDLHVPGEEHYVGNGIFSHNTGKSNGVAYALWKLARKYPRSRHLVLRTERTLLTDSFCKTFEEDVCPGDSCLGGEKDRGNRHEYYFPENRSRIILGGLDKADRWYGGDFDTITLEEAVKFKWPKVVDFFGSLRNNAMGFHAMIYATNPDSPGNWVNQRAKKGLAKRMVCYLRDNPSLFDARTRLWTPKGIQFNQTLDRYTGVQRARHRDGLWRGAEGGVWENYDERVHRFKLKNPRNWREELGIVECRISADWGFRDTGVLIVWGIDNCKRLRALAWRYETKQHLDTWAANCVALCKEFQVTRGVGDPSRADAIALFNDMLSRAGYSRVFTKASNRRASLPNGDLAGLDLVRWGFDLDDVGLPRISFNEDGLRNPPDHDLVEENKPWWGPDEIPEYVHAKDENGEVQGDRTDSKCRDDFCDAVRYEVTDNWGRTPVAPEPEAVVWAPDTYAGMHGTPESRHRAKLERERSMGW